MNARASLLVAAATLSMMAGPVDAHHSFAMFDMERDMTCIGVVLDK
jgi:hypothetical protein